MGLRQGHHHTRFHTFRATLLSAALSGLGLALLSPAVEAVTLQSKSYEYDALGHVTAEKDAAGPKRFAPFLRIYLKGNPLSAEARSTQLPALQKAGVRIFGVDGKQ